MPRGGGTVYEWDPDDAPVAQLPFQTWIHDLAFSGLFDEIHSRTKGVITFAAIVSWGGAFVAGTGVFGTLGTGPRPGTSWGCFLEERRLRGSKN